MPTGSSIIIALNALRLGGSQTYAYALAERLEQEGFHPLIIAKKGPLSPLFADRWPVWHVRWAEGTATEHGRLGRRVSLAAFACTLGAKAARKVDPLAIIASQPWPMYHMAYARRFLWRTAALYGLVHGFTPVEFPPAVPNTTLRVFDAFFASTPEARDFLARSHGIGAGLLGNLFERATYWGSSDLQLEGDPNDVLFLGTLTPNKTAPLRALLRALVDTRGNLKVAGAGPEAVELRAMAAHVGVGARVEWLGLLPDPRSEIRAAGIVVAGGRAAIEAGSSGTPVIVATTDGVAGLLTPDSFDRIAAANFTGRALQSARPTPEAMVSALEAARRMTTTERRAVSELLTEVGDISTLLNPLRSLPRANGGSPVN